MFTVLIVNIVKTKYLRLVHARLLYVLIHKPKIENPFILNPLGKHGFYSNIFKLDLNKVNLANTTHKIANITLGLVKCPMSIWPSVGKSLLLCIQCLNANDKQNYDTRFTSDHLKVLI